MRTHENKFEEKYENRMKELLLNSIMTKSISYQNSDLILNKDISSTIPRTKEIKEHTKEIIKIRKLAKSRIDTGISNTFKHQSVKAKSNSISEPKSFSKEKFKEERGWEIDELDANGFQMHNDNEIYQLPLINSRKIVPMKGKNRRYRFSNIN